MTENSLWRGPGKDPGAPPGAVERAGVRGVIRVGAIELNGRYTLTGEPFKNLLLWRPRTGEALTVVDEHENLFRARVVSIGEGSAGVVVFERRGVSGGNRPALTLLQALPGRERMELIIQKTVELGAARIIPFKSARSISLAEREAGQRKAHRWGDIALRASKQSRREFIAEVNPYTTFSGALEAVNRAALKIILLEKEGAAGIKEILARAKDRGPSEAALLTGPEGGFEEGEIKEALRRGFVPASLGAGVLRTETAAIISTGIVMYELGG